MKKRVGWLAAAAWMLGLPAAAQAIGLYDEAVSGDLPEGLLPGIMLLDGEPRVGLVLGQQGAGAYTVSGQVSAQRTAPGNLVRDHDAFLTRVLPGFVLTGVSVSYDYGATDVAAAGRVSHFMEFDALSGPDFISWMDFSYEPQAMSVGAHGVEALFDSGAGFQPQDAAEDWRRFVVYMNFTDPVPAPQALRTYSYTLSFTLASQVPEPASALLFGLGLATAGLCRRIAAQCQRPPA